MKKMLTMALCATVLLCGCQETGKGGEAPASEPAATATVKAEPKAEAPEDAQQAAQELEQRVKDIYADVARTYGNDVMPNQLKNLALLYCSKDWNQVVAAVNEADKNDEMGFFEADYWVMGQDYQDVSADNIQVEKLLNGEASVTLNLHNCGHVTRLRLPMVWEDGQWMIDDFIDLEHDSDWKQEMKQYLKEL